MKETQDHHKIFKLLAGVDGIDGLSAYEVWLGEGNTGSEEDFFNSLGGSFDGGTVTGATYFSSEVTLNSDLTVAGKLSLGDIDDVESTITSNETAIAINTSEVNAVSSVVNTDIAGNTSLGQNVLGNNAGNNNSALGFNALYSNTTGNANNAQGANALYNNTTGGNNAAIGLNALYSNTTGSSNIGIGSYSLYKIL